MIIIIYFSLLFILSYILRRVYLDQPPLGDDGAFLYYGYFRKREPKEDLAGHISMLKPGIYFLYDLIFTLSGRRFKAIRVFSLVCNLVTSIVLYFLIVSFTGGKPAGILASIFYVLYLSHPNLEPWGETSERYQELFIALSYLLVLLNTNGNSVYISFLAGLSLGISSTLKVTSILNLPVLAFPYIFSNPGITGPVFILTGFIIPWVFIRLIAPVGSNINFRIFWNLFVSVLKHNFGKKNQFRAPSSESKTVSWLRTRAEELLRAGAILWIFSLVYILINIHGPSIFSATIMFWFMIGLITILLQKGRYPQYFYHSIAPACIMSGIALSGTWRHLATGNSFIKLSGDPLFLSLSFLILFSLYIALKSAFSNPLRPSSFNSVQRIVFYNRLVSYIRKNTSEQDYIFQWGREAHIHVRSGRPAISITALYSENYPLEGKYWLKNLIRSFIIKKPSLIFILSEGKLEFPIRIIQRFSGLTYESRVLELGEFKVLTYRLTNIRSMNKNIIGLGDDPVDNSIEILIRAIRDEKASADQVKEILADIEMVDPSYEGIEELVESMSKARKRIEEGEALFNEGNIQGAEDCFLEILKQDPVNENAYNSMGVIAFKRGDIEDSIQYFTKALEIDPWHKETILNVSTLFRSMNRFSDAISILERGIEKFPDDREMNLLLSEIRLTGTPAPKIAFLSMAGFQSFLGDIVNFANTKYHVISCYNDNEPDIESAIKWADVVWLEFANELTIELTKHPSLLNGKHVICRLHSYEALEGHAELVNWKKVNDLIFVADHIKNITLGRIPGIQDQVGCIHVVPNGVDPDKYYFKKRGKGRNLAFLGRVNYKKGPMLLLHAMKELVQSDRSYRLFIGGKFEDDRYRLYFEQMKKEMGLENNIINSGWIDDIPCWLDDKNYMVCTSVLEGHPIGLMEAMASGIRPLIHNYVGARDYYPDQYLWNSIPDFVRMVREGEYDSEDYRRFIVNRFPLKRQLDSIEEILGHIGNK